MGGSCFGSYWTRCIGALLATMALVVGVGAAVVVPSSPAGAIGDDVFQKTFQCSQGIQTYTVPGAAQDLVTLNYVVAGAGALDPFSNGGINGQGENRGAGGDGDILRGQLVAPGGTQFTVRAGCQSAVPRYGGGGGSGGDGAGQSAGGASGGEYSFVEHADHPRMLVAGGGGGGGGGECQHVFNDLVTGGGGGGAGGNGAEGMGQDGAGGNGNQPGSDGAGGSGGGGTLIGTAAVGAGAGAGSTVANGGDGGANCGGGGGGGGGGCTFGRGGGGGTLESAGGGGQGGTSCHAAVGLGEGQYLKSVDASDDVNAGAGSVQFSVAAFAAAPPDVVAIDDVNPALAPGGVQAYQATVGGSVPMTLLWQSSSDGGQSWTDLKLYRATIASSGPRSLQWELSSDGGQTWTVVTQETGLLLSFTTVEADHGKVFRLTATNELGADSKTTPPLKLKPGPSLITVTGTQTYGGSPAFTYVHRSDPGVGVLGTVTCTKVGPQGELTISPTLPVGEYAIYPPSCSGATSVTGSQAAPQPTGVPPEYTGTFTVAPLAVTLKVTGTMFYGTAPSTISYDAPDRPAGMPMPTCSRYLNAASSSRLITSTTPVGAYAFDPASCSVSSANYDVTFTLGRFDVFTSTVVVTVDGTQTYGGSPTFTTTVATNPPGIAPAAPTGTVSCTRTLDTTSSNPEATAITSDLPVGTFTIDPSSCSGLTVADAANYTLRYQGGELSVLPATATVLVTGSSTYGSAPTFDYSVSGLQPGDAVTGTLSCSSNVGSTTPAGSEGRISSCTGLSASSNYTLSYSLPSFVVAKAPLAITASSPTIGYGDAPPSITPSYDGFVGNEGPAQLLAQPTCGFASALPAQPDAGTYTTSCSGAASSNYEISYVAGRLTIKRAPLLIGADATATYGSSPTSVTVHYLGLEYGQTTIATPPTCPVPSFPTRPVGQSVNPQLCSGGASPNYTIAYVPGTYTVTPAELSITASSETITYGSEASPTTPSFDGFVNGETRSVLTTQPSCSNPVAPTTPPGTYSSWCTGAEAENYTIAHVNGLVTVNKAPLLIAPVHAVATYGSVPAVEPSYAGFVNGEDASVLTQAPVCVSNTEATTPAGVYAPRSTCSGAMSDTYDLAYAPGVVTILKATLTVAADDTSRVYGVPNPPLTSTVTGFVNGEDASVITGAPALSTSATPTSDVGDYPIEVDVGPMSADNYTFVGADGTLTVTSAPVTLRADDTSLVRTVLGFSLTYRATLRHGTTGAAVAGQPIEFAGHGIFGRASRCTATTSARGVATCTVAFPLSILFSLPSRYDASFAGTPNYDPASTQAVIRLL